MDVCIDEEISSGLGAFYEQVCDYFGMVRKKDVIIRLQSYYNDDVLPDDNPAIGKGQWQYTGHVVSESEYMRVCQRLIVAANACAYINAVGDSVVIPAGKAIKKYQLLRKV